MNGYRRRDTGEGRQERQKRDGRQEMRHERQKKGDRRRGMVEGR